MIIKDGSITPSVAQKEPKIPPTSAPTYVAIFTANGPGVLSLTAIKSISDCESIYPIMSNNFILNQW